MSSNFILDYKKRIEKIFTNEFKPSKDLIEQSQRKFNKILFKNSKVLNDWTNEQRSKGQVHSADETLKRIKSDLLKSPFIDEKIIDEIIKNNSMTDATMKLNKLLTTSTFKNVETVLHAIKECDNGVLSSIPQVKPFTKDDVKDRMVVKDYFTTEDKEILDGLLGVLDYKCCYLLLAGGHGSRMCIEGAKGCYRLPFETYPCMFDFHLGRIYALQQLFKKYWNIELAIPIIIITSSFTDVEICNYLKQSGYMHKLNICTVVQSDLPVLTNPNKKVILNAEKNDVLYAPAGTGTVVDDLDKSGAKKYLIDNEIRYLQIVTIDNMLSLPFCPKLLGQSLTGNYQLSTVGINKTDPDEATGVFSIQVGPDGSKKIFMLEYTNIPQEMRYKRDADGNLVFNLIHTLNVLFDVRLLGGSSMNLNVQSKMMKVNPNDQERTKIYKQEFFIMDLYQNADSFLALMSTREVSFSPIKKLSGDSSVETACESLINYTTAALPELVKNNSEKYIIKPGESYVGEHVTGLNQLIRRV